MAFEVNLSASNLHDFIKLTNAALTAVFLCLNLHLNHAMAFEVNLSASNLHDFIKLTNAALTAVFLCLNLHLCTWL